MKYVSLFSGIEAATVAWESLGWKPMCFAEIDKFPSAVLAERFPRVPNIGDVTKAKWKKYHGKCDLVVGGSPCQSFSVAGKREGLRGESKLMFEYIRAVREIRPRWFLWENVPGALTSEHGKAFRQLLSEMDALRYGLAWRVLDAQFFGVAQRRERIFLVGHLGERPPIEVLFDGNSLQWDFTQSREKRAQLTAGVRSSSESAGHEAITFAQNSRDEVRIQGDGTIVGALSASRSTKQTTYICETAHTASNGLGVVKSDVSMTLSTGNSMAVGIFTMADDHAKTAICENMCGTIHVGGGAPIVATNIIRRLTPLECERLQGFPDNWTRIPYRGKSEEECPDSPRYKAIGNSMAVPVMRWIGERITQAENGEIE